MHQDQAAKQNYMGGQVIGAASMRGMDPEPPESVIFRSVTNLQNELNDLSVSIDMLCGRPVHYGEALSASNAPEPTTSLLTKKIDEQARRVRMLSNLIATALKGLEL